MEFDLIQILALLLGGSGLQWIGSTFLERRKHPFEIGKLRAESQDISVQALERTIKILSTEIEALGKRNDLRIEALEGRIQRLEEEVIRLGGDPALI